MGRATALKLALDGYSVACCDITPEPDPLGFEQDTTPTHETISRLGGKSLFIEFDVGDEAAVADAFRSTREKLPPLAVVVNNAGVAQTYSPIDQVPASEMQHLLDINVVGVWLCSRSAILAFTEQEVSGSIVNIASIGGLVGLKEEAGYCATKGAVIALTRSLSLECAHRGIRVNAVCPGFVRTAMARPDSVDPERWTALHRSTPLGRLGEPSDVADTVSFLASDRSAWVTGSVFVVDGGFTAL